MSEATLAPLDRSSRNIGEAVLKDPSAAYSTAAKDYGKAADKWAAAYMSLGQSVAKIGMARTTLAALTVRAMDDADETGKGATLADISARLGDVDEDNDTDEDKRVMLNSALPGQWRTAASIYVDLGMTPEEPIARWLTSAKPKGLADAVRKAAKIAAKDGQAAGVKSLTEFADKMATGARKRRELGFSALELVAPPKGDDTDDTDKGEDNGAPVTRQTNSTPGTDATPDAGTRKGSPNEDTGVVVDLSTVKDKQFVTLAETVVAAIPARLKGDDRANMVALLKDVLATLEA